MLTTLRDAALADPARTLGGLRLVVGASGMVSPGLTWAVAGMGVPESESSKVATRLFAARELALAAGALSDDEAVRRATLTVGIGIDALDALSYAAGIRRGAPKASALSGLLALSAVGLGVAARSRL